MSTKPNDSNEQPPEEGEINNKIEPSAMTFGKRKAIPVLPPPSRSKRRVRLEHNDAELNPSSEKRRRYSRRNSKVASMLAPSVTKRTHEESFPNSSIKKPPCTAPRNENDEEQPSLLELTLEVQPDESGGSEKEAIDYASPPK